MKLAILSDIHSNLEALEATFEDFECQQIDAIYCTGDLVCYAANPNEVIQILRQNKVNREAGYLIYDTTTLLLVKRMVQYNVELTIEKIRTTGIPIANGLRLLTESKRSSIL